MTARSGPKQFRRRLLRWLLWLTALSLLFLVLLSVPLNETMSALRGLTWRQVALLVVANALVLTLFNARWWVILRGYGQRLPFITLFGYRLATFGVSYFTPGPHFGGEPLQVLLLEKEQQTPRATAIAALTLDKSLELFANFLFLLTGVLLIIQKQLFGGVLAVAVVVMIVSLVLVPVIYILGCAAGRQPITRVIDRIDKLLRRRETLRLHDQLIGVSQVAEASEQEIGRFLRRAPGSLFLAALISACSWLVMIAEFWLMIAYLGAPLAFGELIVILTAARLAILLFMPAGLGALEAGQALAFGAIGLNPALGISASLLIRARDVLMGGTGLWWASRKLAAAYLPGEGARSVSVPPDSARLPES
ncbi:MAG: lysylphosphatidylglycerol synthase transmembrane domain-containing protein [Candidatus Promineifilaceae bacterium]